MQVGQADDRAVRSAEDAQGCIDREDHSDTDKQPQRTAAGSRLGIKRGPAASARTVRALPSRRTTEAANAGADLDAEMVACVPTRTADLVSKAESPRAACQF
jgi:hypothetical protein